MAVDQPAAWVLMSREDRGGGAARFATESPSVRDALAEAGWHVVPLFTAGQVEDFEVDAMVTGAGNERLAVLALIDRFVADSRERPPVALLLRAQIARGEHR